MDILPPACGIIIADFYNAVIYREAPLKKVHATRRRSQTLRFAKTAADRLGRIKDPRIYVLAARSLASSSRLRSSPQR